MNFDDAVGLIAKSYIFRHWHWLSFHFGHLVNDRPHPLAVSIVNACLECECRMPGYTEQYIHRLAAVGGRNRHIPDWEQILQQLAELYVVVQACRWPWPEGARFEHEPTAVGSNKNPEITIQTNEFNIGIEVKAPAIFSHWKGRSTNPIQFASRFAPRELTQSLADGRRATLPRDNSIKDYLISAEEKFAPFRAEDPAFIGLLVICWDDHIYEPISSLIHDQCGLLTDNSFYRTEMSEAVRFPSVSGVLVLRHLYQLVLACRDEALTDRLSHPLDYGMPGEFPWKAYFPNPHGIEIPRAVLDCFDGREPSPEMGAEYQPQDFIMWMNGA